LFTAAECGAFCRGLLYIGLYDVLFVNVELVESKKQNDIHAETRLIRLNACTSITDRGDQSSKRYCSA